MNFIEREINRLQKRIESGEATDSDYESLWDYQSRLQSIEAERNYLNGE